MGSVSCLNPVHIPPPMCIFSQIIGLMGRTFARREQGTQNSNLCKSYEPLSGKWYRVVIYWEATMSKQCVKHFLCIISKSSHKKIASLKYGSVFSLVEQCLHPFSHMDSFPPPVLWNIHIHKSKWIALFLVKGEFSKNYSVLHLSLFVKIPSFPDLGFGDFSTKLSNITFMTLQNSYKSTMTFWD